MATEPASPGRPPVPVSEHVRVLLVDDDESTAILVRSLLGKLKPATLQAGVARHRLRGPRRAARRALGRLPPRLPHRRRERLRRAADGAAAQRHHADHHVHVGRRHRRRPGDGARRRRRLPPQDRAQSPSLLSRTIRYAIERSRLLNEMRSLARHDHLTGLLTRREMDRVLDEELVRSHRYGHPVALILLDLDHFKQVNDTYGHVSGDAALRWVAVGRQPVRPGHRPRRPLRRRRAGRPAAGDRPRRRLRPGRADPGQGRRRRRRPAARRVGDDRTIPVDAERRRRLAAGVHGLHALRVHRPRRRRPLSSQAERPEPGRLRRLAPARPRVVVGERARLGRVRAHRRAPQWARRGATRRRHPADRDNSRGPPPPGGGVIPV